VTMLIHPVDSPRLTPMTHERLLAEPRVGGGPKLSGTTTLRQSSSISSLHPQPIYHAIAQIGRTPMRRDRATMPHESWQHVGRRFCSRRQLFSEVRITRPVRNKRLEAVFSRTPSCAKPTAALRLFVLDLVSRLMSRGCAPVSSS